VEAVSGYGSEVAWRLEVARDALKRYEKWHASPDPDAPLDGGAIGDLVTVARWFLEDNDPGIRPAGERCER
jgi:hypothetical protein